MLDVYIINENCHAATLQADMSVTCPFAILHPLNKSSDLRVLIKVDSRVSTGLSVLVLGKSISRCLTMGVTS